MNKLTLGFKCGSFALINPAHIHMLKECKSKCDILCVLINSDKVLQEKYGVVTLNEFERMYILKQFPFIDFLWIYRDRYEDKFIKGLIDSLKSGILTFKLNNRIVEYSDIKESILFHSSELKGSEKVLPGEGIVDKIEFIDYSRVEKCNLLSNTSCVLDKIKTIPNKRAI